ncbi:MAG TPA: fumarylacetoacetate hydrolase family protein [Steroidobacteraceae bacterium]
MVRLANFQDVLGRRFGVVNFPDSLADVARELPNLPKTIGELLPALDDWRMRLNAATAVAPRLALKDVTLLAPIESPRHFFAAGLNYADHAKEMGIALPTQPRLFIKLPGTIASPFGSVRHPGFSDTLDYEGELALVVGRTCRDVAEKEARQYIGGFMIANDLSLRALVNQDTLVLGKGCDGFAPQGPWLTTPEEVPDPRALRIRTWVNGELRQDGSTRELIYGPEALLAWCSRGITLSPGDIISTGSPPGSGHGMKPSRYLQPGDRIRIEIELLGAIENIITPF